MSHRIAKGQEYVTCDPRDYIRIRVISDPTRDYWGRLKVRIVTLTAGGRELRHRSISTGALHANGTTGSGEQRRTGYRLVQHADGVPSGEAAGR